MWKNITSLEPGGFRKKEHRNVLGAATHAKLKDADVLVFVRDRDRMTDRQNSIEKALEEVSGKSEWLPVAGAVAIEAIEAWVLAFLRDRRPERHGYPKVVLAEQHSVRNLEQKVAVIAGGDLKAASDLAPALSTWVEAARRAFPNS